MPDAETDLILKSNIKHSVSIQGPNTKIYIYIYRKSKFKKINSLCERFAS